MRLLLRDDLPKMCGSNTHIKKRSTVNSQFLLQTERTGTTKILISKDSHVDFQYLISIATYKVKSCCDNYVY